MLCLAGTLSALSCQKWLEVQPEDKFTEEQVYSSATSIAEVLNGVYILLGNNNLYGRNLTLTTLDLFAQRYYGPSASYSWYYYTSLSYSESSVKSTLETVWTEMYVAIANINQFLENIDIYKDLLTDAQYRQYKGEAMALRAFLHFDLYRMFAPAYNAVDPTLQTIPYYKELGLDIAPFLTQAELENTLLADMDEAEDYLTGDPIISETGTINQNNFRFNYYALKALKARFYYYIGNDALAYQEAKVIIDQDEKFPWVTHALATGSAGYVDRFFYSETIFDVYNSQLTSVFTSLFSESNTIYTVLSTGPGDYCNMVYENNSADYRYTYSWSNTSSGSVSHKIFTKYADVTEPANTTVYSRFMVPIIRKSEMYYIAAQTTTDQEEALALLNSVRQHRNLALDVSDYSNFSTELTKEYQKEFYGEGQLFYYYKRNGFSQIDTPNDELGTWSMSTNDYVLPIPDDEYIGR